MNCHGLADPHKRRDVFHYLRKKLYCKIHTLIQKYRIVFGLSGDINVTSLRITQVGVRQGCLLSPILFNIFLERIATDILEDHEDTVSIGGRTIANLRFADDIDG